MNVPTANIQTILNDKGKPAFVVIPYDQYRQLVEPRSAIPHEVVGMVINKGYSLIKAWRVYLKFSQKEIAMALDISQSAISQIEKSGKTPKVHTINKLAEIYNVNPELLMD